MSIPQTKIKRLQAGLALRLPSGRVVELRQRQGADWLCVYAERVRGEVVFSRAWLLKHCTFC
jgi:hypothetical protein